IGGGNPAEQSKVQTWMDWQLASLNAPYLGVFQGAKKPANERDADFGKHAADLVAQMKLLDKHLAGKSFLALEKLTLADICLGPIVKRCLDIPIDKPELPNLSRWQKAIDARPAFAVATGAKASALAGAA
ncbi:MAG: glutathione binding-like protein, partial [Pseudolabrys sp.]